MRNAWRIAGGEGAAANTANLRAGDGQGRQAEGGNGRAGAWAQAGDKEEIVKRLSKQGGRC